MSIVEKIIGLNRQYEELTDRKIEKLKLHWSYKEPLVEELAEYICHSRQEAQYVVLGVILFDGIELSFTEKLKEPEPQSYMWGREAAKLMPLKAKWGETKERAPIRIAHERKCWGWLER